MEKNAPVLHKMEGKSTGRHAERVLLVILDGWGNSPDPEVSAIARASTPVMDTLYRKYPHAELTTHGLAVGLPEGQMGNSEVGHINIGAGRVVDQELVRINKAVASGALQSDENLLREIRAANDRGAAIHIMGLLSDGGVHSHIAHLEALCDTLSQYATVPVFIHAFSDGRDVDPHSGLGYVRRLQEYIRDSDITLVSIIGRYYAMDRDKRWERTKKAYDLLVRGTADIVTDLAAAVESFYAEGITDEFLFPVRLKGPDGDPPGIIAAGDLVIFFNFRTDRPRQLITALSQTDMPDFGMQTLDLHFVTMCAYDPEFRNVTVLFDQHNTKQTIGEVFAGLGKTQLRIAETEKYPHVTYFFSGGRETPFTGEHRIMIPSPKVATYDLQPEMSAPEVTDAAINFLTEKKPEFICLNYANADMVGHTGVFEAAVKAAETVDTCLGRLVEAALESRYTVLVIADHGNADTMINPDGSPNTAHTMNPVPVILISGAKHGFGLRSGKLADIAPTILFLMGIDPPAVMDGNVLCVLK